MRNLAKKWLTSHWARRSGLALAAVGAFLWLHSPAGAQDGRWIGVSADWETTTNWNPTGVPTGQAQFDGGGTNPVTVSTGVSIGEIRIINAISYTFNVNGGINFTGAGITNDTLLIQNFVNTGTLSFTNSSTVTSNTGEVRINNSGTIYFTDASSAGAAIITNTGAGPNGIFFFANSSAGNANITNDGNVNFFGFSSAGNSIIVNNATGAIQFLDNTTAGTSNITNDGSLSFAFNATAGNATIVNNNTMSFNGNSNAGNANITNSNGAFLDFFGTSSARTATFDNTGAMQFNDNSTAANATITNNFGGTLNFNNYSTAANATIINNSDLNFNNNSTAGNATITNNCCLYFNDSSTAGDATIVNNSTINFTGVSSTVFASAGNATIYNAAFGTINFTGFSTAGNATIVNDDTINFYDDSKAGTARITNNYQLGFYDRSTAQNATIVNNGGLGFFDSATAGNATIINNLQLFFFNSSSAGDSTITVNNGADLVFLDNSDGFKARIIVNAGGVVDFTGTAGPNNDGKVSVGSIEGAGLIGIGNITLYVGTNGLSTTFDGVIADTCGCGPASPGNLVKVGTGSLTLNGANTYTGFTEVQEGALIINGSITSNTTVYANAIIGGNGTIFGDLTINSNGILSPGNSVGTLRIDGNATFNNITYRVEVEAGISDRVNVTGTVSINGGTVTVTGSNRSYGDSQTTVIVTGAGGVFGRFSSVTDNLAFYDASLSYDAYNVYLTLARNANGFRNFALTPNQNAVGGALDTAGTNTALMQRLLSLSDSEVRFVLDSLSGEMFATMAGAFIDESRFIRNAILSRMRVSGFAGFSGPLGYLNYETEQTAAAYAPVARNNPFGALRPVNRGIEFWAQAFGSWAKYNSDSNAATARRASGGFLVGADQPLSDGVRAGLTAGYSNTQTRITDRASKGDGDTFHFAAYLNKMSGPWNYRTGAALALHNVNSERNVLGDTLRADYFAATGQIFGEIGYAMAFRQIAIEPFANLALVHHRTNAFSETGGIAALTTSGFEHTNAFSTLGLRLATRYTLSNGWTLMPHATFGWQHAYGDLAPLATLSFQNTGTGMTIAGTPLARDMFLGEAGFNVQMSASRSLGLFYSATIAEDATEHAVRGKYQWRF